MSMKRQLCCLAIIVSLSLFGPVSGECTIVVETWSCPVEGCTTCQYGATGTGGAVFTSCEGNKWVVVGPTGLNTGTATLTGDLIIADEVPASSGGEPVMMILNWDVHLHDVTVRTSVRHNADNGGGILARTRVDTAGIWGYGFGVDGNTGESEMTDHTGTDVFELAVVPIPNYDTALTYELEFSLFGDTLIGRVLLDDVEVLSISRHSTTHTSGKVGLLAAPGLLPGDPPPLSDAPMSVTFGDFTCEPTGVIPTLTEWGMIIFCVLLFGWMAWVIVRRRKRVTAGI